MPAHFLQSKRGRSLDLAALSAARKAELFAASRSCYALTMLDVPLAASRWLFLGVLLYAPWAYGCTRPWTISLLNALLAGVLALWVLGCALARRCPRVPWPCAILTVLLLAQGWLMATNAHQLHDAGFFQFVPVEAWWEAGPGAVDAAVSQAMMWRLSALLGALLFTTDLCGEPRWLRRLAWTILAAGASIAAFGLVQRILGAPMIFWEEGRTADTFFATYIYHANAGAFLNLVLPMIAALTVLAFRRTDAHLARAISVPALLITIAAAFVNVSKAAMAITVGLLGLLALWQAPRAWAALRADGWKTLVVPALFATALGALIISGGWEKGARRWSRLPEILRANPREVVAEVCWQMSRESGLWGFGPGTFEITFPHYTGDAAERIRGIWRYAHHDYLQTLVEWGWIGSALWAALIFGALGVSAWRLWRSKDATSTESRAIHFAGCLALLGAIIHARVDFPFQIASLQLYIIVFTALGWTAFQARTRRS